VERASGSRVLQILPDFAPTQQSYQIIKSYPHDAHAYTQGLLYHNGYLYESTGQYGASGLRKVNLADGKVLKLKEIPKEYFGEGLCLLNNLLYQLTWRENKCFVYDINTFEIKNTLNIYGEGWGLTNNNKHLIMSNGSHIVSYFSPNDFSMVKQLEVCTNTGYVNHINELELINGELWANVYMTDNIVRIDTSSGAVVGVVNLQNILPRSLQNQNTDVLNGIAYDEKSKRIFVTGKNWLRLYEIIVK
jgi:glutamine cyclotransferase